MHKYKDLYILLCFKSKGCDKIQPMSDSFLKALKWFLFIVFIIGGIAAVSAVEKYGVQPVMLAVFSFGGAYLMSNSWRKLPRQAMVTSTILVAVLGFVADYTPEFAAVFLNQFIDMNFYLIWICLTLVVGVPFMMFIFNKYDE